MEIKVCPICKVQLKKTSLNKHIRKNHPGMAAPKKEKETRVIMYGKGGNTSLARCPLCSNFFNENILAQHIEECKAISERKKVRGDTSTILLKSIPHNQIEKVQAKDLLVKQGEIWYKGHLFRSEIIKAISPPILQSIDLTFTLKLYVLKNIKQFSFVYPNELKALLLKAENIEKSRTGYASVYYPANGVFAIPWQYVSFHEGEIDVLHPNPSTDATTFRHKYYNTKIHSDFQDLMPYIMSRCPNLMVRAVNNRVVEILNIQEFLTLFEQYNEYTNAENLGIKVIKLSKHNQILAYPSDNFSSYSWVSKSPYLNYLSKKHFHKYKIYRIMETRIFDNNWIYDGSVEWGYVFTIYDSLNQLITVYENNTDESRSTYVFLTKNIEHIKVIETISEFFASDLSNKRELLMLRRTNFPFKYARLTHKDETEWKQKIRKIISNPYSFNFK